MSEEAVVEAVVADEATGAAERTTQVETQATASPVEVQARDQGWVSKNEWVASGRDADEWRPAKEFVDRGELYKSIHNTKRELKQTQAALTALQSHHRYIFEKAHEQALRDLKAERKQAMRSDDIDRVEAIETEIEKANKEHQMAANELARQQQAAQQVVNTDYEQFVDKNPWYLTDGGLKDEADAIGFVYMNKGGAKEGLLTHVEREIKKRFPDKFGVRKAAPNAVATVDKTAKRATGADPDLSETEREIMRTFVRSGVMTEAQYKAELKKVK